MRIREFLQTFSFREEGIIGWEDEVCDIALDSREVRPGSVFFALVGSLLDGHLFLGEAVEKGAKLLVVEKKEAVSPWNGKVSWVVVESTRKALALASCAFFGHPSSGMWVAGVTGTNGKTTTCFLLHSILERSGIPCGLLTTARNVIGPLEWEPPNTTMESLFLARSLYTMRSLGIRHAVLEVSSHGLALGRVEGIFFDAAVFTNIVPEHLEFHKTFTHYWESKKKLAEMIEKNLQKPFPRVLAVNGEDENLLAIARAVGVPFLRFGCVEGVDVQAKNIVWQHCSSYFEIATPWGNFSVHLPLSGKHNVCNALGASAIALYLGVDKEMVRVGLERCRRVPGRWEIIEAPSGFKVIVDFAHNWHGLENALKTARSLTQGRLITVFGCGGERDRSKRPQMGKVVANLSDVCIVTTDNPRGEDPMQTASDALLGIQEVALGKPVEWFVVLDRVEAIRLALSLAQRGDIVFLAGKGPERFQVYAHKILPHNDYEVALRLLQERGGCGGVYPWGDTESY